MSVPEEIGWLVEKVGSGPCWWTGRGFSADSLMAVRFVRKEDAERVIHSLFAGATGLRATDHVWVPWDQETRADLLFAGEDPEG